MPGKPISAGILVEIIEGPVEFSVNETYLDVTLGNLHAGLGVRLSIELEAVRTLVRVFEFALDELTENQGLMASGNVKDLPQLPQEHRVVIGSSAAPRVVTWDEPTTRKDGGATGEQKVDYTDYGDSDSERGEIAGLVMRSVL